MADMAAVEDGWVERGREGEGRAGRCGLDWNLE